MKTFLNVLYRRILYKIPLKRLLLLLAVFGVLFVSFSNADYLDGLQFLTNVNKTNTSYYSVSASSLGVNKPGLLCLNVNDFAGNSRIVISWHSYNNRRYISPLSFGQKFFFCIQVDNINNDILINDENDNGLEFNIDFYFLDGSYNIISGNPGYTSLQCQTEYNLIPISSVDQNYCTTNNLCPSCSSCPVGTGGYSQLYINNILHLGAPNIIMNIPEEIDWDYAYTNSGQNFNIDVVGYNVDYEKIDSIVQLQNYKPTDDDFSEIISVLAPYSKIIIFFIVLFSLWAMIKKPFKSKKL